MAIDKSAPDGFKHIIDMTAEKVGQQFIRLFEKNCWKFERDGHGYIDEDWVVNECMELFMGNMIEVFEKQHPHVVDRIRNHPILDDYMKELEDEVDAWKPLKREEYKTFDVYRTDAQRLQEVGMRQSDFL